MASLGDPPTILVTGAGRGLGLATALGLARRGARVPMVARDPSAGREALARLVAQTGNRETALLTADRSELAAVRRLAEEVRRRWGRLQVLINNAAVIPRERRVAADRLEMQLAVNHLAPFLLTDLLLDLLAASAPARVVNVASEAHRGARIDFGDLQMTRRHDPPEQYARTKLMNLLFTYELARRFDPGRITANCLHPGVVASRLLADYLGLPPAPPASAPPRSKARPPSSGSPPHPSWPGSPVATSSMDPSGVGGVARSPRGGATVGPEPGPRETLSRRPSPPA
ncbi:MAG TPA: SDR family NAD(P)-dependent oxidoreductase [Gemmatimonadales bacterium]|nr:SDR family NAD(P)-dependent oxidoreductase [Gemmatimonadales bacterium]